MAKRRRQANVPQGAPRKRRPVRRPDFQPEPPVQTGDGDDDSEAAPTFADEPAVAIPAYGATGPVETRPHWVSAEERRQGRRMQQLRRSARELSPAPRSHGSALPTFFDMSFIPGEMRRIAITSTVLLAVVILLAIILR